MKSSFTKHLFSSGIYFCKILVDSIRFNGLYSLFLLFSKRLHLFKRHNLILIFLVFLWLGLNLISNVSKRRHHRASQRFLYFHRERFTYFNSTLHSSVNLTSKFYSIRLCICCNSASFLSLLFSFSKVKHPSEDISSFFQ